MITLRSRVGLVLTLFAAAWLGAAENGTQTPTAPLVADERLARLEAETGERPADALLELGLAYDERHQPGRAADFYRQAAARGVGAAELRLGALYETGAGVPQSYEEARAHYQCSLSLGVPEAHLRLGLLWLEGWGGPADVATAVAHIEQAATAGYRPAQQILSDMYFIGLKVAPDPKRALAWAERAAADRDPEALAHVGAIHRAAVRRPEDLKQAREWFQLSAEQDYSRGMLGMASTFLRPGAEPAMVQIGLRWLDLAAEGGNSAAAFFRAGAYLAPNAGPLTADHETKARALLLQAAAGGELAASEVLELEKSGRPLAEAFRYVMTVPFDDRYVQRLAAKPLPATRSGHIPPRPLKVQRPVYPTALRLTATQGEVTVEFVVDTTGRVRDAQVVSTTHPGFAEFAAASVSAWRFVPGQVDGRPVNTRMRVPIFFRMSDVGDVGTPRSQPR